MSTKGKRSQLTEGTFYGMWTMNKYRRFGGRYYLGGLDCGLEVVGKCKEEIKRRINTRDWSKRMHIELDISFNGRVGDGTLMICRVPRNGDNEEIVIEGLNRRNFHMYRKTGVVPGLQLGCKQTARVYSISPFLYGQKISLN